MAEIAISVFFTLALVIGSVLEYRRSKLSALKKQIELQEKADEEHEKLDGELVNRMERVRAWMRENMQHKD